ncbi:hypothetical protein ZWY2020_001358 [Hordeum vulgare]|nr:hypothetical protein ZWY2020_001358 [Hordeum vulgare]
MALPSSCSTRPRRFGLLGFSQPVTRASIKEPHGLRLICHSPPPVYCKKPTMSDAAACADGPTNGDEPSLTASTIDAQAVGSHILRINGYSYTTELATGKSITSESFTVGGHRWCLKYYPNGYRSSHPSSISIFLRLDHSDVDEVKAQFRISLLDQEMNPVPSYILDHRMTTFSRRQGGNAEWGRATLIYRMDLERSDYLKDDVFSVRCDVAVPLGKTLTKAIPVSAVSRGV